MAPNPAIVTTSTTLQPPPQQPPPPTTTYRANPTSYPIFQFTLRLITWLTETAALAILIYFTARTGHFRNVWVATFLALVPTFFMDVMELTLLWRAIRKREKKASYKLMLVVDICVITLLVITVISSWNPDSNSTVLMVRLFFDFIMGVLLLHIVCLAAYIFGAVARRAREPIDPMDEWNEWNYVPPRETYRFA